MITFTLWSKLSAPIWSFAIHQYTPILQFQSSLLSHSVPCAPSYKYTNRSVQIQRTLNIELDVVHMFAGVLSADLTMIQSLVTGPDVLNQQSPLAVS